MDEIPVWAIDEAQRRIGAYAGPGNAARNVLAEMIAEHEASPVEPDVLAVRAIAAECYGRKAYSENRQSVLRGDSDEAHWFGCALAAYREHASKRNG